MAEQKGRGAAGIKRKRETAAYKRERQKHEDSMAVVYALDRINNQLVIDEKEDERADTKRGRREWITICLLVCTVTFTVISDAIFYCTMQDARVAAKNAHHDSELALDTAHSTAYDALVGSHIDSEKSLDEAHKATSAALASAKAATDQLQELRDEQRPWVELKFEISGPIGVQGNNFQFFIRQTLHNIGHGFARNVWVNFEVIPITKENVFNTIPEQEQLCARAAKQANQTDMGYILSPGQTRIGNGSTPVSLDQINAAEVWPSKDNVSFLLIGCAAYRLPDGKLVGRTGVTYAITRRQENGLATGFDPRGAPVPPESIFVQDDFFRSGIVR